MDSRAERQLLCTALYRANLLAETVADLALTQSHVTGSNALPHHPRPVVRPEKGWCARMANTVL